MLPPPPARTRPLRATSEVPPAASPHGSTQFPLKIPAFSQHLPVPVAQTEPAANRPPLPRAISPARRRRHFLSLKPPRSRPLRPALRGGAPPLPWTNQTPRQPANPAPTAPPGRFPPAEGCRSRDVTGPAAG